MLDAFRRFSKSLKLLMAIEPINPDVIDEESVQQMIDMKVWEILTICYSPAASSRFTHLRPVDFNFKIENFLCHSIPK